LTPTRRSGRCYRSRSKRRIPIYRKRPKEKLMAWLRRLRAQRNKKNRAYGTMFAGLKQPCMEAMALVILGKPTR